MLKLDFYSPNFLLILCGQVSEVLETHTQLFAKRSRCSRYVILYKGANRVPVSAKMLRE